MDPSFTSREEWDCSSSVAPAITLTSNYVMSTTAEVSGEFLYGRYGNPSRNNLEAVLAAIEDSKFALAFASGKTGLNLCPLGSSWLEVDNVNSIRAMLGRTSNLKA